MRKLLAIPVRVDLDQGVLAKTGFGGTGIEELGLRNFLPSALTFTLKIIGRPPAVRNWLSNTFFNCIFR